MSDRDIREWLLEYLAGRASLDEFEDWVAQHTWNVHQWGSKNTQDLAASIEARLAEHSGSHINEEALRRHLARLAQEGVTAISEPIPSERSETASQPIG